MKGCNTLTQILDFRRVINNQKSVGTRRVAAAAPLDEYSVSFSRYLSKELFKFRAGGCIIRGLQRWRPGGGIIHLPHPHAECKSLSFSAVLTLSRIGMTWKRERWADVDWATYWGQWGRLARHPGDGKPEDSGEAAGKQLSFHWVNWVYL